MTVHSLPLAVVDERTRRTWSGRLQMALILLVCAAPVIASYLAVYVLRPAAGEAAYGDLIQPSVGLPDVAWHRSAGWPRAAAFTQGAVAAGRGGPIVL